MKRILHSIHQYFIPAKYQVDEQIFRKARILVNTSFITFVFALNFMAMAFAFGQFIAFYGLIVCVSAFFMVPWLLKWGVPRSFCANLFVFMAFASTTLDIATGGGLDSPIFPWFCMTPLVAIFLDTVKSAWAWFVITIITAGILGYLHLTGFDFDNVIYPEFFKWHQVTAYVGLVMLMLFIALVMEKAYLGTMQKLNQKNKDIENEKKRSDELLLNILPEEVMNELKQTGRTTAKSYDLVTVMFADFKDFTRIGDKTSPEDLVSAIDEYFTEFDLIMDKHEVEKIKTVGDAYLCAGGIPIANTKNPVQVVETAVDFLKTASQLSEKRKAEGKFHFDLRIGIHSGPVVAGVVGSKKFEYDIWGDAVNTAARMQQNSEQNRINISGTTYELIKHRYNCTYRGRIETKNKGAVDMYFVDSKK